MVEWNIKNVKKTLRMTRIGALRLMLTTKDKVFLKLVRAELKRRKG